MRRFLISVAILGISLVDMMAVTPTWSIDLGSVFDNREGDDRIYEDKTFFMVTLAPEVGLRFTDKDRIAGGAVWNQPLENGVGDSKVMPTLYYRHEGEKWKFSMGMFPRTQLQEPLPGYIWSDSLAYFQRNLRGALVQYTGKSGYMDAYIDWRAHQTETRREAFNIMFHGQWQRQGRFFLAGGYALMNHFAKTRHAGADESIVDNFLVNPYVGIDLDGRTVLDRLNVKAGALLTVERYREWGGWRCPAGFWMEAEAEWKWLGLRNSFYKGGKLFQLYGEFGTLLYQGEAYYRSDFYNRTDVYAHVYRNKYVNLEAQLNFNFARDNFMFYQRLILDIHLGNL